jgi:septum formation topological specificity factor MinE
MSMAKGKKATVSRDIAVVRLEKVLLKDHANVTDDAVALLTADVLDVVKAYADITDAGLRVCVERAALPNTGADVTLRFSVKTFKTVARPPRM